MEDATLRRSAILVSHITLGCLRPSRGLDRQSNTEPAQPHCLVQSDRRPQREQFAFSHGHDFQPAELDHRACVMRLQGDVAARLAATGVEVRDFDIVQPNGNFRFFAVISNRFHEPMGRLALPVAGAKP